MTCDIGRNLAGMALRVVHVSASFPRSPDDVNVPFLFDLVAAQQQYGWDPSVVALHDEGLPSRHDVKGVAVRRARYGPDRWETLAYRGGLVHTIGSPARAALLPLLAGSLIAVARQEAIATRPDVMHGHWLFPGGLAAVVAARAARCRSVVTLHGSDVELAARNRAARRLGQWVAQRADALVAVSEALARRGEAVLGRPVGSISVVRLPLADGLTRSPLPSGPQRLLAAGRASREKGFDVLVAALARPDTGAWQATLVTDGPDRTELERAVRRAGLSDRVTFLPLQPRAALFELIRGHHLVVVPSRSEGLGMVALEALALGRPVVASAVGGLVEVITDGDDGALVPANDPEALANALATVRVAPPVAAAAAAHQASVALAAHATAYGLVASARA